MEGFVEGGHFELSEENPNFRSDALLPLLSAVLEDTKIKDEEPSYSVNSSSKISCHIQ